MMKKVKKSKAQQPLENAFEARRLINAYRSAMGRKYLRKDQISNPIVELKRIESWVKYGDNPFAKGNEGFKN